MRALLSALVYGLIFASTPAGLNAAEKGDPVVGRWRWMDKQVIECLPDQTFSASPTNRKGTWKLVPGNTVERKYQFTWDNGLFTDTLLMSRDGKRLTGKNDDGKKIEGTKLN